jgi:hypothetical protein
MPILFIRSRKVVRLMLMRRADPVYSWSLNALLDRGWFDVFFG